VKKVEVKLVNDSLGQMEVPVNAHWGARTARWLATYRHGNMRSLERKIHPYLIDSLSLVYKTKLIVDREHSMEGASARVKIQVLDEILAGQWREHFVLDPLMSPSGEAVLDNLNEIVESRTREILGLGPGAETTNSIVSKLPLYGANYYFVALKHAVLVSLKDLESCLLDLERLVRRKSLELEKSLRMKGKTEAIELKPAREFNGFGNAAERNLKKLRELRERLLEISIPETKEYKEQFLKEFSTLSCLKPLRHGEEIVNSTLPTNSLSDLASLSSLLKELCLDLVRICQTLFRMNNIDQSSLVVPNLYVTCLKTISEDNCLDLALTTQVTIDGRPPLTLAGESLLGSLDGLKNALRTFNQSFVAQVNLQEEVIVVM
jgi:aspartate ammonia-lyase